jgi:hypothetical protein
MQSGLDVLSFSRPTVCVSRWWAGWDSAGEQEKARSQKNARKRRRIPPVGCTLCWHAFDLQDSLPEKNTTAELLKLLHEPLTLATTKKTDLQMFRQAQQPTLAIQRTFTEQNL